MKKQSEGFILVLTLLILSIAVLVINNFFFSGTVFVTFDRVMIDREKAKTVAMGALELAKSQLTVIVEKKQDQTQKDQKAEKQHEAEKKLLERLLPIINRWQIITLDEKRDGINATIKLCISCEDGKLNLNQLYDFEKKKFLSSAQTKTAKPDDKKDETNDLRIVFDGFKKFTDFKDLFGPFEKFLKDRQYRLNDVTELLKIQEFQKAFSSKVFYEPPEQGADAKTEKRPVYLTDLFTIFSGTAKLEPWLLSDSVVAVLGFTRAHADDSEKRKKELSGILKDFKPSVTLDKDWNTFFKPLYGKEFKSLTQETVALFQTTFEPKTFSVLVHATIGAITQKLYAIIYKTTHENKQEFIVQRLYWL